MAAFDFSNGSLLLTEAGSKKRASLHLVNSKEKLSEFDRGGAEVFEISVDQFKDVLFSENHTLKRALTDPRLFSGIGNAYSDEILHSARLSPVLLTQKLTQNQNTTLYQSTRKTLKDWTERLRQETGDNFPEMVTAFREEMARKMGLFTPLRRKYHRTAIKQKKTDKPMTPKKLSSDWIFSTGPTASSCRSCTTVHQSVPRTRRKAASQR